MLTLSTIVSEPVYHGDQRPKLPVLGSSGTTPVTGNYSPTAGIDWPLVRARELFLTNDTNNDITFVINFNNGDTLGWVLHDGETFNERLVPFNSVMVTAQSSGLGWRWYVRGNVT